MNAHPIRMNPEPTSLTDRLDALTGMSTQELRAEWKRLCRSTAPRISRDLLIRALAYRIQEIASGGLSKTTRRRLAALAKSIQNASEPTASGPPRIRTGARLMREWRGVTHVVVVRQDGFEWSGEIYPSLTGIARAITGAHWSGPRFFGLATASSGKTRRSAPVRVSPAAEMANA